MKSNGMQGGALAQKSKGEFESIFLNLLIVEGYLGGRGGCVGV